MPKKRPTERVRVAAPRGEGVKYNGVTMRPFAPNAEGYERARYLADALATYEDDDTGITLALIVTGLAAIKDEDDRVSFAFFIAERALSQTPRIVSAMNEYLTDYQDREVLVLK